MFLQSRGGKGVFANLIDLEIAHISSHQSDPFTERQMVSISFEICGKTKNNRTMAERKYISFSRSV